MSRTIGTGVDNFSDIIEKNYFYIDKTSFIQEWWDYGDKVTLITRPRRFGKTLMLSMAEAFFSVRYAGKGYLFEGLDIWREEEYQKLQGTYPVLFLSFASVKERTFEKAYAAIYQMIRREFQRSYFLAESDCLNTFQKDLFRSIAGSENGDLASSVNLLSEFLYRYYGKRVIILLDEYDTPMQEAYSNGYWNDLIRKGSPAMKIIMEDLLQDGTFHTRIDEQIVFDQLGRNADAVWSLLLAGGYLKVQSVSFNGRKYEYELKIVNFEVQSMFEQMFMEWFSDEAHHYSEFSDALICGDKEGMTGYLNDILLHSLSYYDTGGNNNYPGTRIHENFYHGFVLGLIAQLRDRYVLTSNKESGLGRYDVMLKPQKNGYDGIILEFKVRKAEKENSLQDAAKAAIDQIVEKNYAAELEGEGHGHDRIRIYAFVFEGKRVWIDGGYLADYEELKTV